jgi:hypothetical protein
MLGLLLKVETVSVSKQKKHPNETSEQRIRRLALKQEKIARIHEKEMKKVSALSVICMCVQTGSKFESCVAVDDGQPNGVAASPRVGTVMVIDDLASKSVCVCTFSV